MRNARVLMVSDVRSELAYRDAACGLSDRVHSYDDVVSFHAKLTLPTSASLSGAWC